MTVVNQISVNTKCNTTSNSIQYELLNCVCATKSTEMTSAYFVRIVQLYDYFPVVFPQTIQISQRPTPKGLKRAQRGL